MKAKPKSNDVKKPALILGIAFIALGCTLGISSLAWFVTPSTKTEQVKGMDGRATGSYFKSGNGTVSSPYIIANERQLYYFNWLQDLGYFNKDEDGNGTIDQQYYFQLEDNIDASGYTLPPAGTSKYPFVGNFDGNGKTISNLVISNVMNDLTDVPAAAKKEAGTSTLYPNAEIVGFFGIIGQYTNSKPTTSEDKSLVTGQVSCKGSDGNLKSDVTYTIRSVSGSTTTYVNSVNNLYFDNLEVSTNANTTLAGLLAGYVNGNMQYCGVRSGYFNFGDSVTGALQDDVVGRGNTLLSKYSIIGDYSSAKNFVWSGKPTSGGTGTDWGGSIDFFHLTKRISYIIAEKITFSSWQYSSSPGKFNVKKVNNFKIVASKNTSGYVPMYKGQTTGANIDSGTYLPLNVDLNTEFPVDSATGAYTGVISGTTPVKLTSTTINAPYETNSFFSTGTEETLLKNSNGQVINTGYLTTGSGTAQADKTFLYADYLSVASQSYGSTLIYSDNTFVPLYYDYDSGSLKRIKSGSNTENNTNFSSLETIDSSELSQYETVKSNLPSFLNSESNLLHGVGWQNSSYSTLTGTFNINGSTYSKLLAPGIDFVLSEKGYITCLYLGNTSQSSNSLFNLYKVTRSGNAPSGDPTASQLTSVTSDGKTYYTNTSVPTNKYQAVFYIEIPVEAGEYFISGTNNQNSVSTSILYLDIGANKGDTPSQTKETTPPIDFVYYSDKANKVIKQINSVDTTGKSDYTPSKVTFAVSGKPTTVYYYRDYVTTDGVEVLKVLYVNSAGEAATVEATGTGARDAGTTSGYGIKKEDETSGS